MKTVLLMLCFVMSTCDHKVKPPVTGDIDPQALPDQESWNSRITFSDSGIVKAIVHATHIRLYEEKKETLLDSGIVVDFFNASGQHSSKLTADRGRVHDVTKDLEAYDNIRFVSDSGTVVVTDYLFWDNDQKKVRSDKFVTVTSRKERLQGYGFEADQNLKNYVIYRVSGRAELVEEK